MSSQKMREALTYIEGLATADDARDLPTIAATAQEALAQPADVGLTDEEIDLINESNWNRKGNTWDDREFARAVIAAHEAKKNGGGV